jgi:hypothetical protein
VNIQPVRDRQSAWLNGSWVHASMFVCKFSNASRWHLPLARCGFTVLIIIKEARA